MSVIIGPFAFSVAHVIFFAAIIIAFVVGWLFSRKLDVSVGDALFRVVAVTLIAARVSYVVRNSDLYFAEFWQIFNVRDGGFDFWVGVIAGAAMLIWEIIRNKPVAKGLVVSAVAGLVVFSGFHALHDYRTAGQLFVPEVQAQTLDGRNVWLNREFRGQPMVINLWATWCPPCVREMPLLEDAEGEYPDVAIVVLNQGENADLIVPFLQEQGLNLDNVLLDENSAFGAAISSQALPTTLFFDRHGVLIDSHVGEFSAARLRSGIQQIQD